MAKSVDTPFKDSVTPKPSFTIKPTLGNDPAGTPSESGVSGSVSPKPLPTNTLDFTKGK